MALDLEILELPWWDLENILVGGLKISYFEICPTKLWLFSKFLQLEKESELVKIGEFIDLSFSKKAKLAAIIVDNKISVDFVKIKNNAIIYEIKRSSKFEKAHYYQVLYYMWYLKNVKGIANLEGIISYPNERKTIKVELTEEKEKEIGKILKEINEIISRPKPPLPVYKKYCRKCAYFEFCFGDT
jgi:CRISPR-associated exonuclease Cas4